MIVKLINSKQIQWPLPGRNKRQVPGEYNQYAEIDIHASLENLPKNGTYVLVNKIKVIENKVFKW